MRRYVSLFASAFLSCSVGANAQTAAPVSASSAHKVIICLTAEGQQLPTAVGADHQAEITMRDSVIGRMREYYPSGKLWRIVPFAHVGLGIRHGVVMSYDEAGKLRKREEYLSGRRQGDTQFFDVTGTLSRIVVFDHDKRVSQQCFTPTGQIRECQEEKQAPQYPGGTKGLIAAIERAAVLPTEEVAKHGFGMVFIKLVVDAHATIIGATVVKAPTANMGQAVLDAVKTIKPFIAPGTVDEEPVSVLFSLPIKIGKPENGWNMSHAYDEAPRVIFLAAE